MEGLSGPWGDQLYAWHVVNLVREVRKLRGEIGEARGMIAGARRALGCKP